MRQADYQKILDYLSDLKLDPQVSRNSRFYDEPSFYSYNTRFRMPKQYTDGLNHNLDIHGSGTSFFNPEEALFKSICEGMERFSNYSYKNKKIRYEIYKNNTHDFVDPCLFLASESVQAQTLGWVAGQDYITKKKRYLPAQLVYLNYAKHKKEPSLPYPHNSTGSAAGSSFEHAVLSGIYEDIERDAFVTTYLNKISPPRVDLSSLADQKIAYILDQCRRYKLKLYVLDITNDIGIPSYLALLIDETSDRYTAVGAKSGLHAKDAVIGAIMESFMIRTFAKYMLQNGEIFGEGAAKSDLFAARARHWLFPDMRGKLKFLLTGPISNKKIKNFTGSLDQELAKVVSILADRKFDIYAVDVTLKEFRPLEFFVAKVLIPGIQPLYLHEHEKGHATDTTRLKQVASFFGKKYSKPVELPHPFL